MKTTLNVIWVLFSSTYLAIPIFPHVFII
jgi:hypothetical protein